MRPQDLIILSTVVFYGFMYYNLAVSRSRIAFMVKIAFLVLSFVLAFVKSDFIVLGNQFALGGRSAVMIVIAIEIADAFVERKKDKRS